MDKRYDNAVTVEDAHGGGAATVATEVHGLGVAERLRVAAGSPQ